MNRNDDKFHVNNCNPDNANDDIRSRSEVSDKKKEPIKVPFSANFFQDNLSTPRTFWIFLAVFLAERSKIFEEIISVENLLSAWFEFKRGKMSKNDVQQFAFCLEDNLFNLHQQLANKTYFPDKYDFFFVKDPKLRPIHKAKVKDRVVFQAVFRVLYHIFDKKFIFDSYSCRFNKGTHIGVKRLYKFVRSASKNFHHQTFALKCDIKKFFYSIDHDILLNLLKQNISDEDVVWLLEVIIGSFSGNGQPSLRGGARATTRQSKSLDNEIASSADANRLPRNDGCGLPLGNVTSQLFANIYLDKLDQFIKHRLKAKYYLRYCDDFIILNNNQKILQEQLVAINLFLSNELSLSLHPDKISVGKYTHGIDFLGYVILPHHITIRTKTKQRMIKKLKQKQALLPAGAITRQSFDQTLQSYLGLFEHCKNEWMKEWVESLFG